VKFFNLAKNFDFSTPVYVDSNLGDGVKGEEISKLIVQLEFKKVYLATGYDPDHFGPTPWLSGIIGKEPPWGYRT